MSLIDRLCLFKVSQGPLRLTEGGAYGAALIAGLGLKWFQTPSDAISVLKTEKEILPSSEDAALYRKSYALYRMIYPSLKDVYLTGHKIYDEEV